MNKIMVLKGGSPAIHKLGNISREKDDYIRVHSEDDKYYVGNFEEGLGFIDIIFYKDDCRLLTETEIKELNGTWFAINDTPLYKIYVDKDGNVIKGKCTTKNGDILAVLGNDGFSKHSEFLGLNVTFSEDIELGRSIVMMTKAGIITTSKVVQLDVDDDVYTIHTKNSIYMIKINKS